MIKMGTHTIFCYGNWEWVPILLKDVIEKGYFSPQFSTFPF